MQIAEGIDDETWLFHLQRGHYSDWLRNGVKDEPLAEAVRNVEQNAAISPAESRMRIKHFIEEKYTAPA